MRSLKPLECPLKGRQLIEAGAGTGKTYTIAILFLRLLLQSQLEVNRVLVVTFTEAATEELRERIRSRVSEALNHLLGLVDEPPDPLLQQLLDSIEDTRDAIQRLSDALVRMDESSIFTIHSFCGRVLQENAFESGMPFDVDLITDESLLRQGILRDFWRSSLVELDREETVWLLGEWATPDKLLKELHDALSHTELQIVPDVSRAAVEQAWNEVEDCYQKLVGVWSSEGEEIRELLTTTKALNRRSYKKPLVASMFEEMDALVEGGICPGKLPRQLERFTPGLLGKNTKDGYEPPTHTLFDLAAKLTEIHAGAIETRRGGWLAQALNYLRDELSRRKQERRQLYFDDLLKRLDHALQGEGGDRLAVAVRNRFPVAMIDEFQDTDPLQYNIFNTLYSKQSDSKQPDSDQPDHALFMIGDPKQAIYSFRGGDIFTYMEARRETEQSGEQYSLDTNWRSSRALLQCVNALFGREAVTAPFIYEEAIGYQQLSPGGRADSAPLRIDGKAPKAMQFWLMEGEEGGQLNIGDAKSLAAEAVAGRIVEMLQQADQGRLLIGDDPLQAHDIALLVRTHAEGDILRQALRQRGVASVALGNESVYFSDEAKELVLLLQALAEPENETALRAALVTRLLGCTLSGIALLRDDDIAWERMQQRFVGYRNAWFKQGFMVGFLELLHDQKVAQTLLVHVDGERRLTNLLHLAELLQIASMEQPGISGLLRWFSEQREANSEGKEAEMRLESDQQLVQIVTIHKSKGLEYPVVFLPFPWSVGGRKNLLLFHDEKSHKLTLDLGSDHREEHSLLAQKESLAERLRLFYVAVTRAKHLFVMTWGDIKGAEHSAPAWLLHQVDGEEMPEVSMPTDLEGIRKELDEFAKASGDNLAVETLPLVENSYRPEDSTPPVRLKVAVAEAILTCNRRIVSYSGLTAGVETERPDHDDLEAVSLETGPVDSVFNFPRGPRAGTFLHYLLEHVDFTALDSETLPEFLRLQLERHGFDSVWVPTLERMLQDVVNTDLADDRFKLADIPRSSRLDEMEFHYPLNNLTVSGLQTVLKEFDYYRTTADGLTFAAVSGLMKGFIDLIVEHDGRFYIVDYKSNHLGNRPEDYDQDALQEAVSHHRYDLQYLIYTLALHRYLQLRLGDYDYERHFGGVYYLFLRGMRPGMPYGIFHDRPDAELVGRLDELFASGGRVAV
ncbi:MAG: exodeoxyribonuclease V subunit beta [Sedimenticola sp.]